MRSLVLYLALSCFPGAIMVAPAARAAELRLLHESHPR